MRKLASKELGVIRKIDYYTFWRDMTGKSNEKIESLIKGAFKQIFSKKITEDSFDEIDFKSTLLKSMISHKIMTPNDLEDLILSKGFDPYTQKILIKGMEEDFSPVIKLKIF